MSNCVNSSGFIFKSSKTYIKYDKKNRYSSSSCQECSYTNSVGSSCNSCRNPNKYQMCIFKLTKEDFVSSTLAISTTEEDAWNNFKKNIVFLKNGNFVISVTKCNKLHSFYANLSKAKVCTCCDVVVLYFKYNILPSLTCYQPLMNCMVSCANANACGSVNGLNSEMCVNLFSNITYDLKCGTYTNLKFFYCNLYTYQPQVCSIATAPSIHV